VTPLLTPAPCPPQGKTSPDEMEFVFLLPEDVNEDADPEKQVWYIG